jgi:hypothetical protein
VRPPEVCKDPSQNSQGRWEISEAIGKSWENHGKSWEDIGKSTIDGGLNEKNIGNYG